MSVGVLARLLPERHINLHSLSIQLVVLREQPDGVPDEYLQRRAEQRREQLPVLARHVWLRREQLV